MSEAYVVALAGTAVAGAWMAAPTPRVVAAAVGVVAVWRRWPLLLVVAVAMGASGQAAAAWQAVEPAPGHPVDGVVTLVSDPEPIGRSLVVDVSHAGRRYTAWIDTDEHAWVVERLAGEQLSIAGTAAPREPEQQWLAVRGVVGSIDVDRVRWWRSGSPVTRVANGLRRTLIAGTDSLSEAQRSLVLGFVLGDDRFQDDLVTDDFRGAGLGHLLAVSGQNVAYVLVLAHPLLSRLAYRTRWPVTLAIVAFFALLTRFEPSVLRASAMAGVAASAAAAGHPAAGRRVLALAVTGLVLVRPLLVHSLAFQLSVAASAGILVISPQLARRLPGPPTVRLALAVTVGAQLAVSPLLLMTVDDVPVAALPANLVAAPAAAPISGWVLTGGLIAGVVGDPAAAVLHLPTRLLIEWVALVARVSSRLPLGQLGWAHILAIGAGVAVAVAGRHPAARRVALVLVLLVAAAPAVALRSPPTVATAADGVVVWRHGGATVVLLEPVVRPDQALAGLRRQGLRRIDVLIMARAAPGARATARSLVARYPVERVWAPQPGAVAQATVPMVGQTLALGDLHLEVVAAEPLLDVVVQHSRGPPRVLALSMPRPYVPNDVVEHPEPSVVARPGRGRACVGHPNGQRAPSGGGAALWRPVESPAGW